jgi:Flp pilus assembly pilin Flp
MLKIRRGQSVLEYAILIVIIIAALLTLQTYIKRGIQGRLKSATDDIGDQFSTANGSNYYKIVTTNSRTTDTSTAGASSTSLRNNTVTNSYRYISNDGAGSEYWGNNQ